jgi:hypothetical protein
MVYFLVPEKGQLLLEGIMTEENFLTLVEIYARKRKAQIIVWSETVSTGKFTVTAHGRLIAVGIDPTGERPLLTLTFIDNQDKTHLAKLAFESFDYEVSGNTVTLTRRHDARPRLEEFEDFSGYNRYEINFPE